MLEFLLHHDTKSGQMLALTYSTTLPRSTAYVLLVLVYLSSTGTFGLQVFDGLKSNQVIGSTRRYPSNRIFWMRLMKKHSRFQAEKRFVLSVNFVTPHHLRIITVQCLYFATPLNLSRVTFTYWSLIIIVIVSMSHG